MSHTNISGGYECSALSDCAFEWMRDRAKQCGLVFNDEILSKQQITVTPKWNGWDGELRDSKTGIYRIASDYIRPIGIMEGGCESVHQTAVTRFNQERPVGMIGKLYRLENLQRYLDDAHSNSTICLSDRSLRDDCKDVHFTKAPLKVSVARLTR